MARLSLEECIERIKEEYPSMYPIHYIIYDGKYLFNLYTRGEDREKAMADFHWVDPETGEVSGNYPTMMILENEDLAHAIAHPHTVPPELRSPFKGVKKNAENEIKHTALNSGMSGYFYGKTWGVSLSHHGIKGQSWGKRNGPPYPLDPKVHDKVVESASDKEKSSKADTPDKGLVDELIIPAAVSIALWLGAKKYVDIKQNKEHTKYKEQNDEISKAAIGNYADVRPFHEDEPPKKIEGSHSKEDDMAAVNPTYGMPVKGNAENCVLCSVAYDIRRRGYDVTSKMCTTGMYTEKVVKEMYAGAKVDRAGEWPMAKFYTWDSVKKGIEKKYPEGARGIISLGSVFGGHAMAFEIQNGKLVIRDAQSNKIRKLTDKELSYFNPKYTTTTRLDHLKINWEKADIACAELKSDWKSTVKKQRTKWDKEVKAAQKKVKEIEEKKKAISLAERKRNYEELWKKDHPDAPDTPASKKQMEKWVELQIES